MNDTITAIATAQGVGSIAIIRVSGQEAISNVNKIFKGKDLTKVASHTINYGYIKDGESIIDEVLVSVMKSPRSYTMEDIVEINSHGGIAATNKILELLLLNGCRLAQPGEFSKRAFLNGRIDLIEADGIMDMINAKTEISRKMAINQITGQVSNLILNLREQLIEILSNISVNIDYPEYDDVLVMTNEIMLPRLIKIEATLREVIAKSQDGRLIREGINTVIIGKPNVGKSSILNLLLEEEKAIVTDIAGTTRDIVEGKIILDGFILNIIDTAGIRKTEDLVESIGVKKSLDLINQADLVLFVLDNNDIISKEELDLLKKINSKNHIIVVNKVDKESKLNLQNLDKDKVVFLSALNNTGIDSLKNKIKEQFQLGKIEQNDLTYITNANNIAVLKECLNSINDIKVGISNNVPIDMLEIDIKHIWSKLGIIIGATYTDELIDQIFSRFCLGK